MDTHVNYNIWKCKNNNIESGLNLYTFKHVDIKQKICK